MKKRELIPWVLETAFLVLCALALFFFSRYARSDKEEIYLYPGMPGANGWAGNSPFLRMPCGR